MKTRELQHLSLKWKSENPNSSKEQTPGFSMSTDLSVPLTNVKMTRGAAGLDAEAQQIICQRNCTMKYRHLIIRKAESPFPPEAQNLIFRTTCM